MYLLDTNVVSDLRRPRPHGAVLEWIAGLSAERLFISAVTVGEMQAGIEITREQDEAKANELESWLLTPCFRWTQPLSDSGRVSCTEGPTPWPKPP